MMLTPEDVKSLEAAKGGRETGPKGAWRFQLSDGLRASLTLAGLDEEEIELCEAWAGLGTPAGVSDECRSAKHVLDKVPIPPKPDVLNPGVLDKQQFWDQMALAGRLDFFWDARHFLDRPTEPRTVLGRVALKVIRHWRGFAEANWPTAADLYWALKRKETQGTKRKRLENETKVGLASIWRLALHLEVAWYDRGHRSSINPEDIYGALGDFQDQVEVNCWSRDDETMLELLKKTGHHANGCSFCNVYSLDSFEFGWGSGYGASGTSTTSCPRCIGAMLGGLLDNTPSAAGGLQTFKWDGGPTTPEDGGYDYRWAVKHGMMWDEFLEKVRSRPAGFDPSKKVLCPLLDQCNTRCAQDQKNGIRGWPLGSSTYETSCYKFRELIWCRDTGGTPEQFQTVERARHDAQAKAQKNAARRERPPKKAAVSPAQEQSLFSEGQRPGPKAPKPAPPTRRATKEAEPAPSIERPRMF